MIPKEILNYGYDDAIWRAYPGKAKYASELAKSLKPAYFYSYAEDSCFRVAHGRFFKKFRGVNPEYIDKSLKEVLIDESQITAAGFEKLTAERKTIAISKEEYDKFNNIFTPWRKSLLRMLFDECTENISSIDYARLGAIFSCEEMPPIAIINDVRAIKGLAPITPSKKK